MKILYSICFILLTSSILLGQCVNSDADPSINGVTFASPCVGVNSTNTLELSWFMLDGNLDFMCTAPAGSWGVQVSFPNNNVYSVSGIANVTAPGIFNWVYDAPNRTLRGYSNAVIGWGQSGTVTISVDTNTETNCATSSTVVNIFRTSILDSNPNAFSCQNAFSDDNANNSDQSAMGVQTVVPVELASFDVKSSDCNEAKVTWATVAEINNSHFDILKSYDGQSFETIATVKGNGTTSNRIDYSYIDREFDATHQGNIYYSLKQVDYDGTEERFGIKSIRNTCGIGEFTLEAYPNPTAHFLNLSISEYPIAKETVTVYINDIGGQLISTQTITDFGGEAKLDLQDLKPGMYLLKLITTNHIMEKRFIKIK